MPARVREIGHDLICHPVRNLVLRWNWKSALLSPLVRGVFVFAASAGAGADAAVNAVIVEVLYRSLTSGFCGAMVEAFRSAEPYWAGQLTVLLVVPLISDSFDLILHWRYATKEFGRSASISLAVTIVSTAFNFFAMRRGVLIVGERRRTLLQDLAMLPALAFGFLAMVLRQTRSLLFGHGSALRGT
jgi:hypothetical protein